MPRPSQTSSPAPASPTGTQPDQSYLPFVDGMRALAIICVLLYHAFPGLVSGGFIGVDVFFVISGFLITRLLAGDMRAERFTYLGFLARRVRRLLPAAFACFAGVALLGAFILLPDAYEAFGRSLVSVSVMLGNFHFLDRAGYFAPPAQEMLLLHTWSLAVEDQFYLIWPLLLAALMKLRGKAALAGMVVAIGFVAFVHAVSAIPGNADYAFYMLAPRAWELMLGAALALAGPIAIENRYANSALALVSAAAIIASAFLLQSGPYFPGLAALPACLGSAGLIVAGLNRRSLIIDALASKPAVFVGLISYSLYLWHWPLLALARYQAERSLTVVETLGVLAASLALATLSWRFVEEPIRRPRGARKATKTQTLGFAVAGIIVFALCGLALREADGLPRRFPGEVGKMFTDMGQGNPWRERCDGVENALIHDDECNFGRRKSDDSSYDIALFGDSNADHFTPLIADWAAENNLAGRQVTQSQCGPVYDVQRLLLPALTRQQCADYHETVRRFVAQNPDLKLVILSANWSSYLSEMTSRVSSGPVVFADALEMTVRELRAQDIEVLLLGRIPHYAELPARCVARAVASDGKIEDCGTPRRDVDRELSLTEQQMQALAAAESGVYFVDISDIFCGDAVCLPVVNGIFAYRDPGHLSAAGARALKTEIAFPPIR